MKDGNTGPSSAPTQSVDADAHDDAPRERMHSVFAEAPLQLTAHEAYALVGMLQAIRGLDPMTQTRLAGNATAEERMALPSACQRLEQSLHANGWALAVHVTLPEGGAL